MLQRFRAPQDDHPPADLLALSSRSPDERVPPCGRYPRCDHRSDACFRRARRSPIGGPIMKYRRLGKTQLRVSGIGVGTWQFGGEWGRHFTQYEVDELLGRARTLGGTWSTPPSATATTLPKRSSAPPSTTAERRGWSTSPDRAGRPGWPSCSSTSSWPATGPAPPACGRSTTTYGLGCGSATSVC